MGISSLAIWATASSIDGAAGSRYNTFLPEHLLKIAIIVTCPTINGASAGRCVCKAPRVEWRL
ncbi:hypothetical protein ACEUZ9_000557 [Paracoccus litorisediminis]|uniref:Uncharacterized protein n=1 Tax=Paracoccus litorisediminis TaxID=2006130 RepID=A0A844HH56_9RHOB|nr:hypothetical protein [Paracoccus litorisediminis]MTH59363.1 hypothetical protein [Paracoccus litorisediminis]